MPGKDGEFDTKSLRSLVKIINTASNYDEEIFQLMVRTGEDEYIKGQTNHAKNIFNAILRVVPGDNKDVKNCEFCQYSFLKFSDCNEGTPP